MIEYKKGTIFVVSASSGTGKTTLCNRLIKILHDLKMSVSHTTRQPRDGEINGVDYYFVDRESFEKMIKNDEFVEYAEVYGHLYGTSKNVISGLLNKGYDILLDIDTQGAKNIKKLYPQSVLIFIFPPSIEELERRLFSRKENKDIIKSRLTKAYDEISQYKFYDYVVVNDDLEAAVNNLVCIILAERLKVNRIKEKNF